MMTAETKGLSASRVLVTPSPLNTVLWRIVLVKEDSYYEGFYSLLDPITMPGESIHFTPFKRGAALDVSTKDFVKANQIRKFSKGFYSIADDGRYISITDLRMGQHPFYAFSFRFSEHTSPPREITPQQVDLGRPIKPALKWIWRRTLGENILPPMVMTPR
jgi:inner membrane protein